MTKFHQLVCLDQTGLLPSAIRRLEQYSEHPLRVFDSNPTSEKEILQRLQGADAVLVSWNTHISGQVIQQLPELKYIGMCCTLYDPSSANVDVATAEKHGIVVKGIRAKAMTGWWISFSSN